MQKIKHDFLIQLHYFYNSNFTFLEVLGYIGALCIGIVLGITGGGGSILTLPVLVYMLNYNPIIATAYSLFIVGTTSGFGTFHNFKNGLVIPKTAILFAVPSVIGVYITRKFIVPAIPETLFYFGSFQLSKEVFLMLLFAIVMLFAAYSMLKNNKENEVAVAEDKPLVTIIIQLLLVGVLIGLIGAGGGFLIVPALLKFGKLPVKKAIATSLLIITINSLFGFIGDIQNSVIDWLFLLKFTTFSVIGIYIGLYIQKFIGETHLKKIFGAFVLLMAVFIIFKEFLS